MSTKEILESLKAENDELAGKVTKLTDFLDGEESLKLSQQQRKLMHTQLDLMLNYMDVLFERQKLIKEEYANPDLRFMTESGGIYTVHPRKSKVRHFDNYKDALIYRDVTYFNDSGLTEHIAPMTVEQNLYSHAIDVACRDEEGSELEILMRKIVDLEQYIINDLSRR